MIVIDETGDLTVKVIEYEDRSGHLLVPNSRHQESGCSLWKGSRGGPCMLLDGSDGCAIIGLGKSFPSFSSRNLARSELTELFMYSRGLKASSGSIYFSEWVSRWPEGSNQTILGLLGFTRYLWCVYTRLNRTEIRTCYTT